MRFSFALEFLKVTPPDSNFGEAWESLCHQLLKCEHGDSEIMQLAPPDRGIDLLRRSTADAYQCKSSERGASGTIKTSPCCNSLDRALEVKDSMNWHRLTFCLNAPFTGDGFNRICEHADEVGLDSSSVKVLGPDYWNDLCEKHTEAIEHFFDYRMLVSEEQVREALKKARYYDSFVKKAMDSIASEPLCITVTNNRCAASLVIPFSKDLTVKQLIDTAMSLYGVNLDRANFPDLGTSCGPSVSLTTDRRAHPFKKKIGELTPEQQADLQLWIKLVWRDSLREGDDGYDAEKKLHFLMRDTMIQAETHNVLKNRGNLTIKRTELVIQATIWESLAKLRTQ